MLGAVGGDAARQRTESVQCLCHAIEGLKLGGHAFVHFLAHGGLGLLADPIFQASVDTLQVRDDVGKASATEIAHVVAGLKREPGLGQAFGHDFGQQRFAVDQGAVAIE